MPQRNFQQRNEEWVGQHPRAFVQPHSRSAPRLWTISVQGNMVVTSWGQLGGKMQSAQEFFNGVNLGQTNEKSPEQYALERAREMCRKKDWEGYRETGFVGGEVVKRSDGSIVFLDPVVESKIDFDNLSLSLSFYKPDNSMGTKIEKLAREGKAWYTRKRNGMMKVLCKGTDGELKIYSRRMLRSHDDETEYTWDDRFPFLIHGIEPYLPTRTILLGELVVEEARGRSEWPEERFDLAQSYIKSLTPKAVQDMEKSGLRPFFYCWDIAFWDGQDLVSSQTMETRINLIRWVDDRIATDSIFRPLDVQRFGSPEEAVQFAKANGWEGYVVIDPTAPGYGDKAYNFKGKPDRPGSACAKLKPAYEDDFIAIWDPEQGYGERSTKGSRAGGIKSVGLYQYNKKGELVFIANVSSGLTKELLLSQADTRLWPQVWKVEYTGRRYVSEGDDTNALDFPRYIETRTDKLPNECVNNAL